MEKIIKLSEVVTQIRGITYGQEDINPISSDGFIPLLRATNINKNNTIDRDNLVYVAKSKVKKEQHLQNGDILIVASSGSIEIVGKAANFEGNEEITFGAFCKVIRPNQEIVNPKYIGFYFQTDFYRKRISFLAQGANINNLKNEHLNNLDLPLPDLETQDKIVAILDKTKNLIEKREKTIKMFDELVRASFLDMFGDPVQNERKWNKKSLKGFGEIITGNTPPRANKEFYNDTYIEWIKTNNINRESLFLSKAEENLSEKGFKVSRYVDENALLVTCIAGSLSSIGRSAISNRRVAFNQQINAIVPNKEVSVYFLYWMIKISNNYFHSFATKGMKRLITKGVFEKIEFIKPDYNLQKNFEKVAINANNLLSKLIHSKTQLENLLNGLSQSAFNGELKFNTAVDLEVLLENNYEYFKDNADKKAIELLLERLDKNELNLNKFYDQDMYDKAKSFVFELLKDEKIKQVFDKKTNSIKLTL